MQITPGNKINIFNYNKKVIHKFCFYIINIFLVTILIISCKHINDTTPNPAVILIDKQTNKAAAINYQEDLDNYTNHSLNALAEIDKEVTKFKNSNAYKKLGANSNLRKQMQELETQTIDLKKRTNTYTTMSEDKWEEFKINLTSDLDNLKKQVDELAIILNKKNIK